MNLIAIASAVSATAAGVLAYAGKDDWGWFLFAAILIAGAASDWKPYSKD